MNPFRVAAIGLLSIALPASALAQTPPADPAAFEVVRLGDGQMTCETLIVEINGLNAQMTGITNRMTEASTEMSRNAMQQARGMGGLGGGGMSTAMSLGSMAAALIPGAGLALGAAQAVAGAAQQAQMASQRNQMFDQMDDMTTEITEATMMMGPISQRVEHLSEISRDKGC